MLKILLSFKSKLNLKKPYLILNMTLCNYDNILNVTETFKISSVEFLNSQFFDVNEIELD